MRWRWTTPKTRGAAPRTRTPRARRSPRMEIAQVRDPAGWDPESSRQASDRPLSARRAAASCWENGEEREGRGGDWLPALPGTRTVRWALPDSWRVPVGGAGQGPGLDSPSSRTLRGPARGPPRPWDLWVVPGAIRSEECAASCLGDPANASSPQTTDFLSCTFATLTCQRGWVVGAEGRFVLALGWLRIF